MTKQQIVRIGLQLLAVAAFIAIVVIVQYTTPSQVGPFGVLMLFLCIYTVMVYIIGGILRLVRAVLQRRKPLAPGRVLSQQTESVYYYASVLAAVPVLLLGMQSVGALSWWSLLLTALFVALGLLYVYKRK